MRAARPSPSHSSRGTIPRAGLLLALAALVALPVALLADPATEQKDADARQKLYVRRAFNDDTGLAPYASDVWVEVRGTVAVLSGQVPSAMLKQRALFLARQIKGIGEVKADALQVVPREGVSDLPSPFAEGAPPRQDTLAGNHHDSKADLPEREPAPTPLYDAVTLLPPVPLSRPAAETRPPPAQPDLATAVEALRGKDERFRRLTAEVRQKTVYLRGTVARWADVNDLTNAVRRLPAVEAVIVDDVRVDAAGTRSR
jgi:osmotically-inducible protein OsmY